jgi:phosphopantothenoylcysteine decarboxylase/phosphopantothenate--cysteine ligase
MFPPSPDVPTGKSTGHIDLALWADALLIAPASANTIAKIAHGLADNFLTTLVLAARCPLLIAPAMDVDMYTNGITQSNVSTLREQGCFVLDPEIGELASGLVGPGRLPEITRLVEFTTNVIGKTHQDLRGKNILVTAGPTQEPIDPVRYIGNRSSGKMGFAVAHAAALRGATVTLISGPVSLGTPRNVRRIDVCTALEMKEAVEREFASSDAAIMAAAVADFAPAVVSGAKIKRDRQKGDTLTLELRKNPDILKSLGERKRTGQVLVGFALETNDGVGNARRKLAAKNLDLVVLNNPMEEGSGFGADTNRVTLIMPAGDTEALPLMTKFDAAHQILNHLSGMLQR